MSRRNPTATMVGLTALIVAVAICHVAIGSFANFAPLQTLHQILIGPGHDDSANSIVWDIRLPRVTACLLTGGILGLVGSAFQALFRNPLSDPYIVGASSGAAIGGAIATVLGWGAWCGGLGVAGCGFVTGVLALWLVLAMARRRGVLDVRSLLLAGAVVGSMLSAVLSLVLLAAGQDTNKVLRWLLGDMGVSSWAPNGVLLAFLVGGSVLLLRQSRRLNALAMGTVTAERLGVSVRLVTRLVLFTGGAMVAASVGTVGVVGFVGLVAPHLARQVLGVDWRWSMPGALMIGALLVVAADLISQRGLGFVFPNSPIPFPVGVVTSIIGAPALLFFMRKE